MIGRKLALVSAALSLSMAEAAAQFGGDKDQVLIVAPVAYDAGIATPLISSYNDAALTAETLLARGFSRTRLTVLTERPSPELLAARGDPAIRDMPVLAQPPARATRAAILAELSRLEGRAVRGSRVVIMFSGHGLQVPDDGKDEQDGLDGLFLPVDVGPLKATRPANAISDDEIARAVEAIRRKGAFVVLLLATSHSGEFIDDLQLGSGSAAVAGLVSAPAPLHDKQYLLPHRDYGGARFGHSPIIAYTMLELAKVQGLVSIGLLDKAAAPWVARHRSPDAIPFGRVDLPVL